MISIRRSAKGNLVGSNSIRCLSFYDRYSPKKHRCKKSFCHWLEYSGPFSVAVMLDDPADVTLLYDERYVGWSSTSRCLSEAAGPCPSSANLFKMFIIAGRNFVDSERMARSCVILQSYRYQSAKPLGGFKK